MQRGDTNLIVLQVARTLLFQENGAEDPTLYFDGSCPLYSAKIKNYASQEGDEQLRFVDVSANNADLGSGLVCGTAMRRFHVQPPDGTLFSSARAFVAVWASLSVWQRAARLAKVLCLIAILEVAYSAILRVRPLLANVAGYFDAQAAHRSSNET